MVSEGETGRGKGDRADRRPQANSAAPVTPAPVTPAPVTPERVVRLLFRPDQHLRRGVDFERVYARKCRGSDSHLLIFGDTNDLGYTRIGLSVSKKVGSAVQRNRLKRLLREAFRLSQFEIPAGLDLILIPRQGTESSLGDYQKSLIENCRYLGRKLRQLKVHRPG